MPLDRQRLKVHLAFNNGRFYHHLVSSDRGRDTIGVGFDLGGSDADIRLKEVGLSLRDVLAGAYVSDHQIEALIDSDINEALEDLPVIFPRFDSLDPARSLVLASLRVELGATGFRQLMSMIAAVNSGDFVLASSELAKSVWASNLGIGSVPRIDAMRTGKAPDPSQETWEAWLAKQEALDSEFWSSLEWSSLETLLRSLDSFGSEQDREMRESPLILSAAELEEVLGPSPLFEEIRGYGQQPIALIPAYREWFMMQASPGAPKTAFQAMSVWLRIWDLYNGFIGTDTLSATRRCYWAAQLFRDLPPEAAAMVATTYEPPDSKGISEQNHRTGRVIGLENPAATNDELWKLAEGAAADGRLRFYRGGREPAKITPPTRYVVVTPSDLRGPGVRHLLEGYNKPLDKPVLLDLISPEVWYFLRHPLNSIRGLYYAYFGALNRTQEHFKPTGESGYDDRRDAVRHCYWSALMFSDLELDQDAAQTMLDNHEKGRPDPYDYHNNAVGRSIGLANKGSDEDALFNACLAAAQDGRLKFDFSPNPITPSPVPSVDGRPSRPDVGPVHAETTGDRQADKDRGGAHREAGGAGGRGGADKDKGREGGGSRGGDLGNNRPI